MPGSTSLMGAVVGPSLGHDAPVFVHDYPASQAALARLRTEPTAAVAERFELYVDGLELANGFHELGDAAEQRRRFERDLAQRARARAGAATRSTRTLLAALGARAAAIARASRSASTGWSWSRLAAAVDWMRRWRFRHREPEEAFMQALAGRGR